MTGPARIGCFVTVMFTHVVVGALASRHLRAANPPQVPLITTFLVLRNESWRTTSP